MKFLKLEEPISKPLVNQFESIMEDNSRVNYGIFSKQFIKEFNAHQQDIFHIPDLIGT